MNKFSKKTLSISIVYPKFGFSVNFPISIKRIRFIK